MSPDDKARCFAALDEALRRDAASFRALAETIAATSLGGDVEGARAVAAIYRIGAACLQAAIVATEGEMLALAEGAGWDLAPGDPQAGGGVEGSVRG